MTPFLSEKKLTTSPGAGAGSAALLPAGLRAGPAAPPRKGCAPRVRAGAGRASGSTAGAADRPEGRGLHRPAAEPQPTSRSGADTDKCERDPRLPAAGTARAPRGRAAAEPPHRSGPPTAAEGH